MGKVLANVHSEEAEDQLMHAAVVICQQQLVVVKLLIEWQCA
jgi:hypothetical protein